jgi:hypothetical protein
MANAGTCRVRRWPVNHRKLTQIQVPVLSREWRFKSSHPHQLKILLVHFSLVANPE